jgi:hypothetical protein
VTNQTVGFGEKYWMGGACLAESIDDVTFILSSKVPSTFSLRVILTLRIHQR